MPEEVINNFGYEELNKGNIQEAVVVFKRNIKQNPNSANAHDGIADAYVKASMWNEAIVASEKAVELARKYNDPHLSYFIEHLKRIQERSKPKSEK